MSVLPLKTQLLKTAILIALSASLVMLIRSLSDQEMQEHLFSGPVMGTQYSVKVVAEPLHEKEWQALGRSIDDTLKNIDALLSTYKDDSEISQFNRLDTGQEMTVSQEFVEVIQISRDVYKRSGGYFDITVGPLVDLWGFGPAGFRSERPSDDKLLAALDQTGMDKLVLNAPDQKLKKTKNVRIDLSAVAKGYGADQVATLLDNLGYQNFLVEVGGEIFARGVNLRGTSWILGIEAPDELVRSAYSLIELSGKGMATSGDYRNYFEQDGIRYSHTINPMTGEPVKHRLASVTVKANKAALADAWATALLAMGETEGVKIAKEQGLDAFFIYRGDSGFEALKTGDFTTLDAGLD